MRYAVSRPVAPSGMPAAEWAAWCRALPGLYQDYYAALRADRTESRLSSEDNRGVRELVQGGVGAVLGICESHESRCGSDGVFEGLEDVGRVGEGIKRVVENVGVSEGVRFGSVSREIRDVEGAFGSGVDVDKGTGVAFGTEGWTRPLGDSECGVKGKTRKQEKKIFREVERKRRREQERVARAVELEVQSGDVVSVSGESESSSVLGEKVWVPEWRRKGSGKKSVEVRRREERMRLSKFAGCDEVVKKELLESQAKRYIAENNAAIVKANEQARRVAANLKAGVPERTVEVQRLQLDKRMNKFAEDYMKDDDGVSRVKTVLSEGLEDIIAVPVMSEGSSVSPDSSISVAQVNKMIKLIHGQASENEELRKAMGKLGIDDSGIASATSVEPALTGYGFFPAEDDLAHQLEFYSDY